jgi:hypothetical protein
MYGVRRAIIQKYVTHIYEHTCWYIDGYIFLFIYSVYLLKLDFESMNGYSPYYVFGNLNIIAQCTRVNSVNHRRITEDTLCAWSGGSFSTALYEELMMNEIRIMVMFIQ